MRERVHESWKLHAAPVYLNSKNLTFTQTALDFN